MNMFAMVDCNAFYCSCERLFDPSLAKRPVIVLSNNDGCAVSRSEEAKALGIEMGTPEFMIYQKIRTHNIAVFSSNYTLYEDISERVMQTMATLAPGIEVYSIDEVVSSDPRTNTTREFSPFYSLRHAFGEQMEKAFWYAIRRDSQRPNDEGTEMFMSLVDLNFNPRVPAVDVLNVRTTCTNRDLPARLPFGGKEGDFEIEGTALLSRVRCLTKPTETIRPPQRRAAQWRLISHLNLNYLSLVAGESITPEALQEILHLYNFSDSSVTRKQILGITGIESRKAVRKIGKHIGAGFVRGIETTLTFDEDQFVGSGMFLFAAVLERFLGLYASLNSFNQMTLKTEQREGIVKQFPVRAGEQDLL